ncbi:MAG: MBL fold metallo-hydrolase [Pseudolabrys sp.]
MTSVCVTVHRSTQEIGGNCVEIATNGNRLILDVGRPLDASNDAVGLLPKTLELAGNVEGILISHPHLDHYGLLAETPAEWPVYCGAATEKLIRMTSGIFGKPIAHEFHSWRNEHRFSLGPFAITPYLTDHSAFDAYMLLIEVGGKRIFYSGDFRTHGRKGVLVDRVMAAPPRNIDVLLMEGTNLGSDKPTMSESDLEESFITLFKQTRGRVFVAWSAQNIDRTVTLYRACLQAGRTLVVDLYTAEVLDMLCEHGKLPQAGWPNLKVVVTSAFARMYRKTGREDFVERMAKHGIAARRLAEAPAQWVSMIRNSLLRDYETQGVIPTTDDAWSWSMWNGYLKNDDGRRTQTWFESGGALAVHIHTSGHASPADLKTFANRMQAKCLVPIHGVAWDYAAGDFPAVRRLADGEALVI